MKKLVFLLPGLVALLFTACKTESNSDALYNRIGGLDTISSVVDTFLVRIEEDTAINSYFMPMFADSLRTLNFRNHFINQICEVSGGPCVYTGKKMSIAHDGMQITDVEFDAFIIDFSSAMTANTIDSETQSQLLGILEPLRSDIVAD